MPKQENTEASNNSFQLPRWLELLFAVVIALELMAPIVTNTFGVDGRLLLKMIAEFNALLVKGIYVPTWTPEGFYHFGATTFYFYPPLTFYLGGLLYSVGLHNLIVLFQTLSFLFTILSFFSARWLLRSLGAFGYQLNLASALYAFAPLRIAELYTRSSIATHITYLFLPLICGALISIVRGGSFAPSKRIMLLGLCCSLTALTDVPIAVMVAISSMVVSIVIWKELTWRASFEIMIALMIAALLSLFHFTAAWTAQSFSRLRDLHFPHHPGDIKLYFHLGPGTYHLLLLYIAAGMIAGTYVFVIRKGQSVSPTESMLGRIGVSIASFVFFLDLFPISSLVWNHFPPLDLVQFPWRFYPLLLLFGALLVGLAQNPILKKSAAWVSALWIIGAILPIVLVIFSIHIFHPFERPLEDATEYLPIYFNPPITTNSNGIRKEVDRLIRPHALDAGAVGNFNFGDSIQATIQFPYFEQYNVRLQDDEAVTFHRFYWPYWHLYAHGHEIPSRPDSLGRAVAELPAGNYTATWRLERTPLETAGLWVSGFSWAGVILFFGIGFVQKRVKRRASPSP